MLDVPYWALLNNNVSNLCWPSKSIELLVLQFHKLIVISWCEKSLPLQIPEVRLNIISNLDCVNQGKVTVGTVKWIVSCRFCPGVKGKGREHFTGDWSAWLCKIDGHTNCYTIALYRWQDANKDMSGRIHLLQQQWVTRFYAPKALKKCTIE